MGKYSQETEKASKLQWHCWSPWKPVIFFGGGAGLNHLKMFFSFEQLKES